MPLNNAQIVRGVFVYTLLNMANLIPFTKRFESFENLVNLGMLVNQSKTT